MADRDPQGRPARHLPASRRQAARAHHKGVPADDDGRRRLRDEDLHLQDEDHMSQPTAATAPPLPTSPIGDAVNGHVPPDLVPDPVWDPQPGSGWSSVVTAEAPPTFVAIVHAPASDEVLDAVRAVVDAAVAARREWLVGPPRMRLPGDGGEPHVGVVLDLLPVDPDRDPAVNRRQMGEIRTIVGELRRLNYSTGLDIVLEIDGRHVTRIFDGRFEEPLEAALEATAPLRYGPYS